MDPEADQKIKEYGRQSRLLHKHGYWKWNKEAQQFLKMAEWEISGIVLAKVIKKIKGSKNEK